LTPARTCSRDWRRRGRRSREEEEEPSGTYGCSLFSCVHTTCTTCLSGGEEEEDGEEEEGEESVNQRSQDPNDFLVSNRVDTSSCLVLF